MRSDQVWARVLASFLVPGLGQALTGRRWRAIAWGVVGIACVFGIGWSIWMLFAGVVMRVACAVDAFVCTRKPASVATVIVVVASLLGGLGILCFLIGFEAFRAPSSSMMPTVMQGDKLYVETWSHHVRDLSRGEVIVFDQPCTTGRKYVKRIVAIANDRIELRCGILYINGKAAPAELVAAERTYQEHDDLNKSSYERRASHYRETIDDKVFDVFDDVERPRRTEGSPKDYPVGDRAPSCADALDAVDSQPSRLQAALQVVRTKPDASPCEPQAHVVVPPDSVFVLGDSRHNSNDSRFWGVVPVELVLGRVVGIWGPLGRVRDL